MKSTLDFPQMEQEILKLWQDNHTFAALQEKNKTGKPFRFLDGPITANNPMGVHHAWGRSLKDIALRYKAMNGYHCHYRNGFDAQGLWVEVEVEKELGFKGKRDIEAYGMDRFTRKCEERVAKYSGIITQQSIRLGQWMDWEHSYFTHTDENITAIWYFLKTCFENGWLEKSYRPVPWCPRCGTSLSEHEMSGSHQEVTHTSVFVKLPVREQDFDILLWTTTPWTLTANVALAVNPQLVYALVQLPGAERPLVLAKTALKYIDGEKQVLRLFPGSELVGLHYETCFPELALQDFEHSIVAWDDVAAEEGSGVVHIAPGCGAEDFELGQSLHLPQLCPIDDNGILTAEYAPFHGLTAAEAAPVIFAQLQKAGKLLKTMEYTHSYPVCWRCKHEVLFRLVPSWVIRTDGIRPKLLAAARTVKWEPAHIGKRMEDWLQNMGDWNISRKRYYGLPLPFYPCEQCGHLTVIGSKAELRELGGPLVDELPELHRPWIDSVSITCPHCGAQVQRITEVGDVWLDAGIVPFSTLGYFTNREEWQRWFPAEWVTEMQEQVRLWFYSQLFMSVTLTGRAPYERVLGYSSVVAEDGTHFSKTGFMIRFDEAADRLGADVIRYLFAGAGTSNDVRFGYTLGEEAKRKIMGFWQICVFFETYASLSSVDLHCETGWQESDFWVLARIAQFNGEAKAAYENYKTADVVKAFELCVEDLSNWYVRSNRRRFWQEEDAAFSVLYRAIKTILQIMAPIMPFLTESLWQNMIRVYEPQEAASIHLSAFPTAEEYDPSRLRQAETARQVVTLALKLRNEAQIKVRQPLTVLYLVCKSEEAAAVRLYEGIVLDELNIKQLVFLTDSTQLQSNSLTLNFRIAGQALKADLQRVQQLLQTASAAEKEQAAVSVLAGKAVRLTGYDQPLAAELFTVKQQSKTGIILAQEGALQVALDTVLTDALVQEGYYREVLRQCQVMRKEIGLQIEMHIQLSVSSTDVTILQAIKQFSKLLQQETLADSLKLTAQGWQNSREIAVGDGSVLLEMKEA